MSISTKPGSELMKTVTYNPFAVGNFSMAVPTTEAQREMWATLAFDKEATLCYNESLAIDIAGEINPKLLELAFQELLKRHDALRSVFSSDGKYFFIKDYAFQAVEYQDWTEKSDQDSALEKLKTSHISFHFDLKNGPLFIGTLIKLAHQKYSLIITGHHIVCDGWSFAILLTELTTIYSALVKNVTFSYEPAAQFSEYAIQEAKQGLNSTHKGYWVKEFQAALTTKKMPLDFVRPKFRTYNSERFDLNLNEELVKKIKKFSSSQGCSLYTTLMATFQVLIHKINGTPEVVIGMASAAQSDSGKSDLVGHLVNLLPLRNSINPDQSFKFFMKEVRTKMLDAFDHQRFSFGSLLKELNIERNPAEIPLLNTVFNIDQQSPGQGLKFDGPKAKYTTTARTFENFELFVNVVSCENSLTVECQYNKNLFKGSTIQNWFESYVELIQIIISNPESTIADLKISGLHIPSTATVETKVAPKTETSAGDSDSLNRIQKIWKNVLELEKINTDDNFFSIGGHSLLALELASQLETEFKTAISIRDIFENPTIEELASRFSKKTVTKSQPLETIKTGAKLDSYPVSHNQMQIWYLEEMFPNTLMHNLPSSIRLKFAVDASILEKTLQFMVQRHPALRTAIVVEHGEPVQKILDNDLPQFRVTLPVISAHEENIVTILNEEANSSFDKELPPLFTAKLYKLGPEDYVFFFMVHHAIWDGWCFDIFFEELNTIYSALAKNEQPKFEKNPEVTYADYTLWLKQNIDSGKLDHQVDYWREKLKSPLPILELPNDFKRPVTASHVGSTFPFQLTTDQANDLRAYAKKQGTSLFNVLLTAFKVTLSRYANLDDVIVGSPVRARNQTELLQTIGYFVNTVALRTAIDMNESFEDNLKKVTQTCLEAFDCQSLPFQVVLNKVDHPKDSSRTPIFQTFFSYQDVSNRQAVLNGHPYVQINIDKASTHTDLDLWVKANDKKIEGAFEYRQDLFKEITIQRFYECFINLVTNLVKDSGVKLSNKSLATASHQELILKDWNNTLVDASDLKAFHHTFEEQAKASPDRMAVSNAKTSLSYGELNKAANSVAHGLIRLGVRPGDLVGISLNRELNMMVAILGILKSGAGYVPLDPAFPQDRLDYMLESSTPKALITESSLAKRFSKFGTLTLIDELLNDQSLSRNNPEIRSRIQDTMYVIYTSGSTGKPKGVQISHGALANFLVSMSKAPGINRNDKLLAVTTLSFDIATLELYLPLTMGASLYLATSYDVMDGKALKQIIENHQINIMQATPSSWRLLLAAGWAGSKEFKALCGGEPFPKDLAHKPLNICGSVWNMYGPTETTVWSTTKKLSLTDETVSIGYPIDNTYTYILDESRNLAPIGAPGELYIGGLGLADGYFRRPDLTSERFVPNPFVPGEKMYATGDFARYSSTGDIECLGRQDGQVKVRGYRIELGEIEAVLSKVSAIKENAVITKEVKPGDVRIIAFLVMKNSELLNEKAIRDELSVSLPKYMIPSHFYGIDALPRTLNGKIDKKTLGVKVPEMKETTPMIQETAKPVSDDLETQLNAMWSEVLGVKIASGDNFFNVGGNSLLAVKLFSKIAKQFHINLPLSLLLESENFKDFVIAFKNKIDGNKNTIQINSHLTSVVTIKAQGQLNPVFCFHGVGGNVLNYKSLVSAVGDKRPIIGIQSKGMDGQNEMAQSFPEMAAHYIREMKVVQPKGPYFLAGGSMGGMIALEVAQQLQQQGESIEKLVMFDTFGPKINIKGYDKSERSFLQNLRISFYYRRKVLFNLLVGKLLTLLGVDIPLAMKLFDVEMNNYRLLWKYKPSKYSGDLHLIRAKLKASGWYSDPLMGWSETILGNIHTYEIEGSHGDFIESPELTKVFSRLV